MKASSILLGALALFLFDLSAAAQPRLKEIPPVFIIGEHEQEYEALMDSYKKSLLDVCGNDMAHAFDLWMGLVEEMEAYSQQTGFDLNGVKAWFHVFFEKDGTIARIGFHLKPASKNVDVDELTAFLSGFITQYKFPFTALERYASYTSVGFPSIYNRPLKESKKGG